MSVLSDVKELYGTLETTWDSSRAHILTHVVLVVVVFWLFGATLPQIATPHLDPKEITENDWFKLAKDTGFVYIALVVPFLAISIYAAVLRQLGQIFLGITAILVSPHFRSPIRDLTASDLEPLALAVNKEDFEISDLFEKTQSLIIKIQSKKLEQWASYQKGLTKLTQNSVQYFGDFSVFLAAWLALFHLWPATSWAESNHGLFWPVTIVLLVLIVLSWIRVWRVLLVMPRIQLQMLSAMIRFDPEMSQLIEVPEERRERVRKKLEELLLKEREDERQKPSVFKLILSRLGVEPKQKKKDAATETIRGRPFPDLFRQGQRFAWSWEYEHTAQPASTRDIVAYLYYSIHQWLSGLGRSLWQMLRYLLIGAP